MTRTKAKTQTKKRPLVLLALNLLRLSNNRLARLGGWSQPLMSHWGRRRPIPAVTHEALWFVVARFSGALGPDDPPMAPSGIGLAHLGDEAPRAAELLAEAARTAIAQHAPDEETVRAGAELGQKILDKLEIEARKERLAELDNAKAQLEELERSFAEYKREAAEREKEARRDAAQREQRARLGK